MSLKHRKMINLIHNKRDVNEKYTDPVGKNVGQ